MVKRNKTSKSTHMKRKKGIRVDLWTRGDDLCNDLRNVNYKCCLMNEIRMSLIVSVVVLTKTRRWHIQNKSSMSSNQ